jgi:hypothetical protein
VRRHRFEPASLVLGLVLLGLATVFVLDACGVCDLSDPEQSAPMAVTGFALAAVTGVLTQVVRGVRGRRARRRRGRGGPGPGGRGPWYDAA